MHFFTLAFKKKPTLFTLTPDFEKLVVLLTPALISVSLIFKTGGIRAGVKGASVKKGPAEKGLIRYIKAIAMFTCFREIWELHLKFGPNLIFRRLIFGGLIIGRKFALVSRRPYILSTYFRGGLCSGFHGMLQVRKKDTTKCISTRNIFLMTYF